MSICPSVFGNGSIYVGVIATCRGIPNHICVDYLHVSLLQLVSGQLVFSVTKGSTRPVRLRLDQVQVSDGRWHDLQLELRDVRSGRETRYVATVRLDFGLFQVRVPHCPDSLL